MHVINNKILFMVKESDHKIIEEELTLLLKNFYFISGHILIIIYFFLACFHVCIVHTAFIVKTLA